MRERTAKSGAQRVAEHRARERDRRKMLEQLEQESKQCLYSIERALERGVKSVTLQLDGIKWTPEHLEDVPLHVSVTIDKAIKAQTKKNGRSKTATDGTHPASPASQVQETVSHKRRNSATVKVLKAQVGAVI